MLRSMTNESLPSTLRSLPSGAEPSKADQMIARLVVLNNQLDDLKLKQDITNELLIELVELGKGMARSDFGAPVRPIRNKPFPHPIRRRYGSKP